MCFTERSKKAYRLIPLNGQEQQKVLWIQGGQLSEKGIRVLSNIDWQKEKLESIKESEGYLQRKKVLTQVSTVYKRRGWSTFAEKRRGERFDIFNHWHFGKHCLDNYQPRYTIEAQGTFPHQNTTELPFVFDWSTGISSYRSAVGYSGFKSSHSAFVCWYINTFLRYDWSGNALDSVCCILSRYQERIWTHTADCWTFILCPWTRFYRY